MGLTAPQLQSLDRCRLPARSQELAGKEWLPRAEPRIAELINKFNVDVDYALNRLPAKVQASRAALVPENEHAGLSPRAGAILDRYAVVDSLALYYRDKTQSTFILLIWLAFAAMVVFEGFAHLVFPFESLMRLHPLFLLYPALWLGAFFIWLAAHRREYQKKYQDYRALAEGLRVQFFWDLLGLPDKVEEHYLQKQKGELEWIRDAIRRWRSCDEQTLDNAAVSGEQRKAQKALVRKYWVQGQVDYFSQVAGPREEERSGNCRSWAKILFGMSLFVAIVLWVVLIPGVEERVHELLGNVGFEILEGLLIFISSMLLVGAALWVAFGEKMAFAEHGRQYRVASICFQRRDQRLSDGELTKEEADLFLALGKDALAENGDWLLLHRDRPLEVIMP
jgi:hypothetical protein